MLENGKNLDRRKIRTQQFIKDAFISLLKQKDFHSITVTDITRLADVNRATFYFHYHDKYDLIQKLIDEASQELEQIFNTYTTNEKNHRYPLSLYFHIFEHIQYRADFYKVMLTGDTGNFKFWRKVHEIIHNAIYDIQMQLQPDERQLEIPRDIVNRYISSAILGVIIYWLEKGMPYTPEYLAEKLTTISDKFKNNHK